MRVVATVAEDEIKQAQQYVVDVLADWLEQGGDPYVLLLALSDIIEDIEARATGPIQ